MSFTDIYQISGSAMTAQTLRLNTVASNLANANAPASSEAQAYKKRAARCLRRCITTVCCRVHIVMPLTVPVCRCRTCCKTGGAVKRYEPHSPLADANGDVWYPDVNVVEQMADMMSASRDFETNVDVLNNVKSMQQSLLKLGEA